jgi:hypothetical protein
MAPTPDETCLRYYASGEERSCLLLNTVRALLCASFFAAPTATYPAAGTFSVAAGDSPTKSQR